MSLISLIITLIVVGVLLWLINTYIPMDGKIKQILNAVVVIVVVIWLLNVFGLLGNGCNTRVPRVGSHDDPAPSVLHAYATSEGAGVRG